MLWRWSRRVRCLNSAASAFKSTELVYIHCVYKGEICRCSKEFYLCFVGLSRNTYRLRRKHGRTKKSSRPFVANSPADELFTEVRSPVLIRLSSFFDDQNTFENNNFDCERWPIPGIKRRTNWDLKNTFSHATLVCYEISIHFDGLKGHKNVGTSKYFFARSQHYVYILWRDAKKSKTSTNCAKKSEYSWPCYWSINTLWYE